MYEHASVKKCACLVSNLNDVIITRSRERFLWRVAEASLAETLPSCVAHAPRPWVASGPTQFVQRCGLVAHVGAREVVIGRQGRACAAPQPLPGQRSYNNLKTEIIYFVSLKASSVHKGRDKRGSMFYNIHTVMAGALVADTAEHCRHQNIHHTSPFTSRLCFTSLQPRLMHC